MVDFEYSDDRKFFIEKLNNGNEKDFDLKFGALFDFGDPKIKRAEFNKNRKKTLENLIQKHGEECQLEIHEDCCIEKNWHVDHIIPLSTNELNKKLRSMKSIPGRKVPAQSFGSNDVQNLTLACSKCNSYKKHKIILPKYMRRG